MSPESSFMLFASGWMLLAIATLPAQVSGTTSQEQVTPGTVVTETFPLFDDQIAVSQAHVEWLATKEDAGMQATLRYLASVNGSTVALSSINRDFRMYKDTVSQAGTDETLESGIGSLCSTMQSFRSETDAQLEASDGNPADLKVQVQSAIAGTPAVKELEDQYWETRSGTELSGFDKWVGRISVPISQLQESGYEVTAAQEKLTEITAMRSSLANALRARNDAGIGQARETIHAASIEYATTVRNAKKTSSENEQVGTMIDQSEGVLTRSGMMNADLKSQGVNCTQTQMLVEAGHYQISTARTQIKSGNGTGARETLFQCKVTLQSLRDAYRGILIREDLPGTTAQGVLSVARSLDVSAARMGAN